MDYQVSIINEEEEEIQNDIEAGLTSDDTENEEGSQIGVLAKYLKEEKNEVFMEPIKVV